MCQITRLLQILTLLNCYKLEILLSYSAFMELNRLTIRSLILGRWVSPFPPFLHPCNRELKQQRRRRRLQKRHLKSEVALLQTLSRLFHLVYFVKCWQMFLELNSKGLYQSSGNEKKVVVLCSRLRQNVNSGTFTL